MPTVLTASLSLSAPQAHGGLAAAHATSPEPRSFQKDSTSERS